MKNFNMVHDRNETEIHKVNNPCSDDYILTLSCLLRWQSELQNISVAIRKFHCKFWLAEEKCRYDLEPILIAQKLHKAQEIKQAVEKVLTYLFTPRMIPVSNPYKKRYWLQCLRYLYLSKVSSFDMLLEELACLYGRRYLSDEYMSWVIQKLNSM